MESKGTSSFPTPCFPSGVRRRVGRSAEVRRRLPGVPTACRWSHLRPDLRQRPVTKPGGGEEALFGERPPQKRKTNLPTSPKALNRNTPTHTQYYTERADKRKLDDETDLSDTEERPPKIATTPQNAPLATLKPTSVIDPPRKREVEPDNDEEETTDLEASGVMARTTLPKRARRAKQSTKQPNADAANQDREGDDMPTDPTPPEPTDTEGPPLCTTPTDQDTTPNRTTTYTQTRASRQHRQQQQCIQDVARLETQQTETQHEHNMSDTSIIIELQSHSTWREIEDALIDNGIDPLDGGTNLPTD